MLGHELEMPRRGGGGLLAFKMGRGEPPACLKPEPVPIRLATKKTPCPNLEINTDLINRHMV